MQLQDHVRYEGRLPDKVAATVLNLENFFVPPTPSNKIIPPHCNVHHIGYTESSIVTSFYNTTRGGGRYYY